MSNPSFALPGKDEVDVESVKAPPRDVRDILLVLSQARTDKTLIEKATKILALPVPSANDKEVLNHYYYRRAAAEEVLANSKGALESLKKTVIEFPSSNVALRIDELFQYSQQEALRGNALEAKKISEQGLTMVPQSIRGWKLSFGRQIVRYCLVLGDFDCAKTGLNTLENEYSNLVSVARNANYLHRINWELGVEATRALFFGGR
ncbi:hypothetical protein [Polynucleobacter necessarius]|uniref:hypothetical protein n=1 Tax=Polynucleobacter necessarius TaxID=576610 RepID=UPI000E093661|nr:hypothetical protein [Polynucleobacter necessarius]